MRSGKLRGCQVVGIARRSHQQNILGIGIRNAVAYILEFRATFPGVTQAEVDDLHTLLCQSSDAGRDMLAENATMFPTSSTSVVAMVKLHPGQPPATPIPLFAVAPKMPITWVP